jgi:transcription-repair coupling factor (superfamily II helicase)
MYLELLEETIKELKGEEIIESVEPDINVRIQALIPDTYMPDIRIRLAWYRNLSQIEGPDDLDRLEEQMADQFGRPPQPVIDLLGLMLIRSLCRKLGIRDLSSGPKAISLAFTAQTKVPPQEVVKLATREKGRISLTPDMRLNIRMETITWPKIYDELLAIEKLCDHS